MRLFSLILFLFIFSCKNGREAPDVSAIHADVTVHRFDKDFFGVDTSRLQPSLQQLEQKYPAFLPLYFKFFAPVREIAQQQGLVFTDALLLYYRFIRPLYNAVEKKYASLREVEKGLEDNLRYIKHYYPSFQTPC